MSEWNTTLFSNIALILVILCVVIARILRRSKQSVPLHPALKAIDIAGGVGVAVVWIAVIYIRVPLAEIGHSDQFRWASALYNTLWWVWLVGRFGGGKPSEPAAAIATRAVIRAVLYGVPCVWALLTVLKPMLG